jgi:hypothetical protein
MESNALDPQMLAALPEFRRSIRFSYRRQVWENQPSRGQATQQFDQFLAESYLALPTGFLSPTSDRPTFQIKVFCLQQGHVGLATAELPTNPVKRLRSGLPSVARIL